MIAVVAFVLATLHTLVNRSNDGVAFYSVALESMTYVFLALASSTFLYGDRDKPNVQLCVFLILSSLMRPVRYMIYNIIIHEGPKGVIKLFVYDYLGINQEYISVTLFRVVYIALVIASIVYLFVKDKKRACFAFGLPVLALVVHLVVLHVCLLIPRYQRASVTTVLNNVITFLGLVLISISPIVGQYVVRPEKRREYVIPKDAYKLD